MADYKKVYSTEAVNTGGRDGKSYLTDGSLEVEIRTPKEMGGPGGGNNPEQLFALGFSACFNGAMDIAEKEAGVDGNSLVKVTVHFNTRPENDFKISADFEVGIEGADAATVQKVSDRTHEICPYSKAVDGNMDITTKVVDYKSLEQ